MVGVTPFRVGDVTVYWLPATAAFEDEGADSALHPDDNAYAAAMPATGRRREFVRSRLLIRRLTAFPGPLTRSPAGVITWPPGLVGSLTHKSGHVGVAFGAANQWASLGIDGEETGRLRPEFESRLAGDAESRLLTAAHLTFGRTRLEWLAVLFSFKESLFKSHFPLGKTMFYFHDAEIDSILPDAADTGLIGSRVLKDTSPSSPARSRWQGAYRFFEVDGVRMVLTATGVPHPG